MTPSQRWSRTLATLGLVFLFAMTPATPRNAPPVAQSGASLDPAISSVGRAGVATDVVPSAGSIPARGADGGAPQPALAFAGSEPIASVPANRVFREGTLSYVSPAYGPLYLALPDPRGTLALICGQAACVSRYSTDYGPDQRVNPERIADLSAADWSRVCGLPLSVGLCRGTVTVVARADLTVSRAAHLPKTDMEGTP